MKSKEVLIIGAGIAGCAVALALAKRGISVTMITSAFDQRSYHAFFPQMEQMEQRIKDLQQHALGNLGCSRALEQLTQLAKKSIDELLEPDYLVDKKGNVDIHRCLQEQLKQFPHVEWILNHSAIELLTLETHSSRQSDIYKKTTCLGAYVYNHETHQIETFLAKETILATGGAASLFRYSTHGLAAKGDGLAMAYRAGARLLNLEDIQFHPLALFERDRPCFPLPIELLKEGGKLHTIKHTPIDGVNLDHSLNLTAQMYEELFKSQAEHLWLDLTLLDSVALKEKFPLVDAYCLSHGFNIAKDPLPVVPTTQHTFGGIAVDRVGQTTLHRLRAIGEVACTGLACDFRDEEIGVLESLTWAITCAEDLSKQLSKFVYYFPEIKEWNTVLGKTSSTIQEDWQLLRSIMWHYVGIKKDHDHLKRGYRFLEQLKFYYKDAENFTFSLENWQLFNAIQTALLIVQAALEKVKINQNSIQLAYLETS